MYDVTTDQFVATNPTISISDGQAIEGQAVTFTISLSHATAHDVTVTYFTQQGTATGMGVDYFGTPGTTVTIPAGQTSANISINTRSENLVEPNETFFVNLSNPVGGSIADSQGVGTIVNDDVAQPHITMTAVSSAVVEGGTIQYLFTRTGGDLSSPFSFTWNYNPPLPSGAATPGVDFVDPVSKVITFAAGQTQATLDFLTIADGVYEGTSPSLPSTEAFAITFVPNGYTFTVVSNIATIVDGDAPPALPSISVSQNDAVPGAFGNVVNEGDDVTFTFTRTGDLTDALTVEFQINSTAPGSAVLGDDFDFEAGYGGGLRNEPFGASSIQVGSVTFEAGSATATLTLLTDLDGVIEGQPIPGFDFETFSFGVWPGSANTYLTDLAHSSVSVQLYDTLV